MPKRFINADDVEEDHILSATVYYRVRAKKKARGNEYLVVTDLLHGHGNLDDNSLNYGVRVAAREAVSADTYDREEKVPRGVIVDHFLQAKDNVLTIKFEKASGEKRTLRGIRKSDASMTKYGQSYVYDLDQTTYSSNVKNEDNVIIHRKGDEFAADISREEKLRHMQRLVTHSKVYELILNGVKYVKK